MIYRLLSQHIEKKLSDKKVILVFGPRQTGKTTLLKSIFENKQSVLWLNGDDQDSQILFNEASVNRFKTLFNSYKYLIVDEAQSIPEIGLKLKLITDHLPEIKLIATGSSSFDLVNKTSEPLTGRKWEYQLFPLSYAELCQHHGLWEETTMLKHRLIYGYYPEIVMNPGNEKELLNQLASSYLYKDVLIWGNIRHSDTLIKLLQALALQLGNEVSYNELSRTLGIDKITVEKYIDLLEKAYVVFRLHAFSRNARNEIKRGKKIYFYDNGIRNALISNFNDIDLRNDKGALWENFLISERKKYLAYHHIWASVYFWRTHTQVELDYIEEADGKLMAYEFKYNDAKALKSKVPGYFTANYPNYEFKVISPKNINEFLNPNTINH
ncbi:MAG: ATP-binding protein [Bacteroidales bacterium]|nr:ATP-binding protein [Bacteroidales bacterium]